MALDDGQVRSIPECSSGFSHKAHQEIHGPAHVGSDQDGNPIGQALECRAPRRVEAGGADDKWNALRRANPCHRERALRQREIDHDIN